MDNVRRDWPGLPMTSSHAHSDGTMLGFAGGAVYARDMHQPLNPVIGGVVQQRHPLEARNPSPASPPFSGLTGGVGRKKNKKDYVPRVKKAPSSVKKQRVVWEKPLHELFLQAIGHLGGDPGKAVPKKILELMKYPGLTRENVASHLQKYRLGLKKKIAEKSNEATGVGPSTSLPNQLPPYDQYGGYPGHQNWDIPQQYYPLMMNPSDWRRQYVPPYEKISMGEKMAPPYESVIPFLNNEFSQMGMDQEIELYLLSLLQPQDPMAFRQLANAAPRQPYGSVLPNRGATFDMQGTVPFPNRPDSISSPTTPSFGSVPTDQQGGSGINEDEHGVNGLAQGNTSSPELSFGTALAPLDQQGPTDIGLYEVFGVNGLGQANGPTGSGRGFEGNQC